MTMRQADQVRQQRRAMAIRRMAAGPEGSQLRALFKAETLNVMERTLIEPLDQHRTTLARSDAELWELMHLGLGLSKARVIGLALRYLADRIPKHVMDGLRYQQRQLPSTVRPLREAEETTAK